MSTTRPLHEIKNEIDAADEAYTLAHPEDFTLEGYNENRATLIAELEDWFDQNSPN